MTRTHLPVRVPGEQLRSKRAWRLLLEDLEGAAECNRAQEEELTALREQLAHTDALLAQAREDLAEEMRVRGLCDAMIGGLFQQREYHAGHARYAYDQLTLARTANSRATEVIRHLRAQLHGLVPRTDPAPAAAGGAVAVRSA